MAVLYKQLQYCGFFLVVATDSNAEEEAPSKTNMASDRFLSELYILLVCIERIFILISFFPSSD